MPNWLINTLQAISKTDIRNTVLIVDGMIILGLVYLLAIKTLPQGNNEIMYMALGIVLGVYANGRNYLFGQSKSENDKMKSDDQKDK